jgi:hypothetical protein
MLQKMTLQELQNSTVDALKQAHAIAKAHQADLQKLKSSKDKRWTEAMQEDLDATALYIVDIEDVLEEKTSSTSNGEYEPKAGTEKMVHLSIVRGRRFNPMTGKEESPAYTQMFTFAEWQLFKKTYKGLGYTIMAALHDPYGDAAELVQK